MRRWLNAPNFFTPAARILLGLGPAAAVRRRDGHGRLEGVVSTGVLPKRVDYGCAAVPTLAVDQ